MAFTRHLKRLANVSPAIMWRMLSRPRMIPMMLTAPSAAISTHAAIRALFPEMSAESITTFVRDLITNDRFFSELNRNLAARRYRRTTCSGWHEFLYLGVRCTRPNIVIETGTFDGESSAAILQAMADNGAGMLISVDLPAVDTIDGSTQCMRETRLPPGLPSAWVVPDYLRDRFSLVLGDSRLLLPGILKKHPRIEIFVHDSLHTFDHQYFEYSTAWPHLADGGLLVSDDIFWSHAFHKFCRAQRRKYVSLEGFGAVRKS
jgi:Methyltransferase domain